MCRVPPTTTRFCARIFFTNLNCDQDYQLCLGPSPPSTKTISKNRKDFKPHFDFIVLFGINPSEVFVLIGDGPKHLHQSPNPVALFADDPTVKSFLNPVIFLHKELIRLRWARGKQQMPQSTRRIPLFIATKHFSDSLIPCKHKIGHTQIGIKTKWKHLKIL